MNSNAPPAPQYLPSDFFQVALPGNPNPVSRTTNLLQAGDIPSINQGQWPDDGIVHQQQIVTGRFAVNPVDPTAIVLSSDVGNGGTGPNIFRTSGPSTGTGITWFEIGAAADLDGTYAPALAFGAPHARAMCRWMTSSTPARPGATSS